MEVNIFYHFSVLNALFQQNFHFIINNDYKLTGNPTFGIEKYKMNREY